MGAIKFEKVLFKVHTNGKVGDWRVHVAANEDGTATLTRESTKVLGGKAVVTATLIREGKNLGKSNETTALSQAISEAISKVNNQLDKGYVEQPPKIGDKATNRLNLPKPMLAQPFSKFKGFDKDLTYYAQPKLDGHRMIATVAGDGKFLMYSRGGKQIVMPHIEEQLRLLFMEGAWDGKPLDGELYVHGLPLQRISQLVKKHRPETLDVTYYVYDTILDIPFNERLRTLKHTFSTPGLKTPNVVLNDTTDIASQHELDQLHAQWLSEGYEGTILRESFHGYEDGKRSRQLLKVKDFIDDEFKVVDWQEGKPYIRPEGTFRVPVFTCETREGKRFQVLAAGTMEEKHEQHRIADTLIGSMLTVKFFNYTVDKIPNLPVALRWRDDL